MLSDGYFILSFFQSYMQAMSLIITHSPEYLLKFMEGTLEEVTSQKHTIQGCCLCQYVERNLATVQVQPHVFPPVAQPQIPGLPEYCLNIPSYN